MVHHKASLVLLLAVAVVNAAPQDGGSAASAGPLPSSPSSPQQSSHVAGGLSFHDRFSGFGDIFKNGRGRLEITEEDMQAIEDGKDGPGKDGEKRTGKRFHMRVEAGDNDDDDDNFRGHGSRRFRHHRGGFGGGFDRWGRKRHMERKALRHLERRTMREMERDRMRQQYLLASRLRRFGDNDDSSEEDQTTTITRRQLMISGGGGDGGSDFDGSGSLDVLEEDVDGFEKAKELQRLNRLRRISFSSSSSDSDDSDDDSSEEWMQDLLLNLHGQERARKIAKLRSMLLSGGGGRRRNGWRLRHMMHKGEMKALRLQLEEREDELRRCRRKEAEERRKLHRLGGEIEELVEEERDIIQGDDNNGVQQRFQSFGFGGRF